jgi:hypothetical protein
VALLTVATAVFVNHQPAVTYSSVVDEQQDCGAGCDYHALESCLIERYDWPALVAERFSDAMRYRDERDPLLPTDWDAFERYAADLRAVYRALGVEDLEPVEWDISGDSSVRAFSDSIDGWLRDSTHQAWRIKALLGRRT